MTQSSEQSAAREAATRKRTERTLIFIVVFLGLLMVAGIVAVVLRVIYLSSQPATQPASRAVPGADAVKTEAVPLAIALPPGGVVKSLSLAGDRMAVHYEAPTGAGIAVVDVATGAVVRRFNVVPGGEEP